MEAHSREILDLLGREGRVWIRVNNTLISEPCAWCGTRTSPSGIDPFTAGSYSLICERCAEGEAPGLLAETRYQLAAITVQYLCQEVSCPLRDEAERERQRMDYDRIQRQLTRPEE